MTPPVRVAPREAYRILILVAGFDVQISPSPVWDELNLVNVTSRATGLTPGFAFMG